MNSPYLNLPTRPWSQVKAEAAIHKARQEQRIERHDTDPIFVCCARCDGDPAIFEERDGSRGCKACDGFGSEEIEGEPIEMEDLPCVAP